MAKEKKAARATFVLTWTEAAAMDEAAERAGLSRSGFVRRAILIASGLEPEKGAPPRSRWRKRKDRRSFGKD